MDFGISKNLPITFLEYIDEGETIKELKEQIKGYKKMKTIPKYNDNGFIVVKDKKGAFRPRKIKDPLMSGDSHLDLELKEEKIDKLIIMGVNKISCVMDTSEEAISRGYKLFSSEDIMNEDDFSSSWYKLNCEKFFETHKELIDYFSS